MARLIAGFASSHGVMLTCTLEDWLRNFRKTDVRANFHDRRGSVVSYGELLAMAPANAAELVSDEAITRRYQQVQADMARMRDEIASARLDVLIVCGDDQNELFSKNLQPALAIYHGADVLNGRKRDVAPGDWFRQAQNARLEDVDGIRLPTDAELGTYLIHGLMDEFDVAALAGTDPGKFIGHAYSFIHKTYLEANPVPMVPIFLNTHYEPNPINPKRCVALGLALRRLIENYPKDVRVGFLASGGLSHFQVEEDLDAVVIKATREKDLDTLSSLDVARLKAGSSEIRNWLVLAGVCGGLDLDWISYTPGYRTEALTGTGQAFATWYPPSA
ncbi:MAG: protocatechuate 3,4-dioxygenase [Burkholderiaceae bacterium]